MGRKKFYNDSGWLLITARQLLKAKGEVSLIDDVAAKMMIDCALTDSSLADLLRHNALTNSEVT